MLTSQRLSFNYASPVYPAKIIIRPSDRPWFNSELRHNIRLRDRLRRKALKTNNNQDKIRYKTQKHRVNNIKKHAKETYMNNYEDLILKQSCGSTTFWQLMDRLAGKQSKTSIILETPNDSYAFTDLEKANLLNNYFCSISTIDVSNINLPEFNIRTESSLLSVNIETSEVIDVLSNLKLNKAVGPDGISHRMLKHTCHSIATPLCKLFNLSLLKKSLSLQKKSFPILWKLAHVMPIFKKRRQITNKQL